MHMRVDEPFGYDTDNLKRAKSSKKYWDHIESNVNKFWTNAFNITREESGSDMLDKLYKHFVDNYHSFKFEMPIINMPTDIN